MKVFKIMALAVLLFSSTAHAAQFGGVEETSVYLAPHYFTWEEFYQGQKLLREQGWLIGGGGLVKVNLRKAETGSFMLTGRAELFGGVADYDGQTQSVNLQGDSVPSLPVSTDAVYFGAKGEADFGWRVSMQQVSVEPFFGLGSRWWLRHLKASTTLDMMGSPARVDSATEEWSSLYLRLGGRLETVINNDWRLFVEGGLKYPFYTENSFNVAGIDVTVKPDGRWSGFAELGVRYKQLKFSTYYEGFRYGRSDGVPLGYIGVFQPTSKSDTIGFRVGWVLQ